MASVNNNLSSPFMLRLSCSQCTLREHCVPLSLSLRDIDRLEDFVSARKRIRRDEPLYRAGDRFEALYAVRLGFLKCSVMGTSGREQVTNFHMSGEIVGLDGIANEVHACDVIALEDTEVCVIPYDRVIAVAQKVPEYFQHIQKILSREIVRQHGQMLLLGSMHAEERLAAFLLTLSHRFESRGYSRSEFVLRMTRAAIGSYLGLKLETVSRVLSRFSQEGYVTVNQKHVQIVNPEALHAIVAGQTLLDLNK